MKYLNHIAFLDNLPKVPCNEAQERMICSVCNRLNTMVAEVCPFNPFIELPKETSSDIEFLVPKSSSNAEETSKEVTEKKEVSVVVNHKEDVDDKGHNKKEIVVRTNKAEPKIVEAKTVKTAPGKKYKPKKIKVRLSDINKSGYEPFDNIAVKFKIKKKLSAAEKEEIKKDVEDNISEKSHGKDMIARI